MSKKFDLNFFIIFSDMVFVKNYSITLIVSLIFEN